MTQSVGKVKNWLQDDFWEDLFVLDLKFSVGHGIRAPKVAQLFHLVFLICLFFVVVVRRPVRRASKHLGKPSQPECFHDFAEEWDNLGFGLTTKDTNMVVRFLSDSFSGVDDFEEIRRRDLR